MSHRILLVEDDEHLRKALAELLARLGYEVAEARNGRAALKEMAAKPAELVITDMIMPDMEGVETIFTLRRFYPTVKIIAMSDGGLSSAERYLAIARALGCHRTLVKPIIPWEFVDAVQSLIDMPSVDRRSPPLESKRNIRPGGHRIDGARWGDECG